MKPSLRHATLALMLLACTGAASAAVSVSIGQPGFYGHIDIGGFPPPPVIYERPVVVERVTTIREPVYVRVPRGHEKHWRKHCWEYDACGRPVYFVRDEWYRDVYAPRYREEHYREWHEHHGHHGHHGRDRDWDDRYDRDDDHDHDHGRHRR